ncbi:MAG: lipid A deacylase LpxR family protein [Chitinophagaceae bacterium]
MQKGFFLLFICMLALAGLGQDATTTKRFIRIYEDNDGINALFKGQDWGYTNGTRLDYFSPRKKQEPGLHQKKRIFSPKYATNGWSLLQVMITPKKTFPFIPDKNDYPYAGALMVIHTRHKADPVNKRNLQTEWVAGVMGPPALVEQTQVFLHRLIGDPRPNGWDYQLPADVLLNYNLTYEKQVAGKNKLILVAGVNGFAGTLSDALSVYSIIRFQKNLSYFSGLASQYFPVNQKKPGLAFSVKPSLDAVLYNALLDGGLFNSKSPIHDNNAKSGSDLRRKKIQARLDIMLHVSFRQFSLSFTQKAYSPDYKNYCGHKVGNVSLCVGW